VGFALSYDPESYAGGSVATGRVSNAGQTKRDTLVPQVGGLQLHPIESLNCWDAFNDCNWMERTKCRRKSQDRDQRRAIVKEAKINDGL
jgi:hypothetical protein